MEVLGIIPARGGSKGVPGKNLRALGGVPLLSYTAEIALTARHLDRVILTTDDREIARAGTNLGLDVPFIRPPKLAQDETPMLPVVQHAVRALEKMGQFFDAVCLLQPTNPFRPPGLVDKCIETLWSTGADAVVSVLPVPSDHNPHWVYFEDSDGTLRLTTGESEPIPRRQDLPAAFHRDGSVYVTRTTVILQNHSLYGERLVGVITDPLRHVNIDTLEDWRRAEALLYSARNEGERDL